MLVHILPKIPYLNTDEAKNFPLMLTRACIDPFSEGRVQSVSTLTDKQAFGFISMFVILSVLPV